MQRPDIARIFLLLGLIVIFGYFGIDKFLNPLVWIGWIPSFVDGLLGMPKELWLKVIGVFEILCAILLIIPVRDVQKIGAALIALQLLAILPIAGFNDIGLRDFGLLMGTTALWMLL